MNKFAETMTKMLQEQNSYFTAMGQEADKMRGESMEQMQNAMSDYAQLMRSSMEYQAGLVKEWQEMSTETWRAMVPSMMSAHKADEA